MDRRTVSTMRKNDTNFQQKSYLSQSIEFYENNIFFRRFLFHMGGFHKITFARFNLVQYAWQPLLIHLNSWLLVRGFICKKKKKTFVICLLLYFPKSKSQDVNNNSICMLKKQKRENEPFLLSKYVSHTHTHSLCVCWGEAYGTKIKINMQKHSKNALFYHTT